MNGVQLHVVVDLTSIRVAGGFSSLIRNTGTYTRLTTALNANASQALTARRTARCWAQEERAASSADA